MAATAASVSAALRRAGFRPVAPSDRSREGLKCSGSGARGSGRVRVAADLDGAAAAARLSFEAFEALETIYACERSCAEVFYVVGPRAD